MIHFAGHVEYHSEHPDMSGLKLSDMPFTSRDIPKPSKSKSMPAILFLNACQSGRIADWKSHEEALEKSFGFAHTLKLSGVNHILGTFWEIRDEPGSLFAIEFYQLFLEGLSVGKAVKQASINCKTKYSEDPCWVSYVLFGDPTFQYISPVHQTRVSDQMSKSLQHTPIAISERKLKIIISLLVLIVILLAIGLVGHKKSYQEKKDIPEIANNDSRILEILKTISIRFL
jgi:hypothetical protein